MERPRLKLMLWIGLACVANASAQEPPQPLQPQLPRIIPGMSRSGAPAIDHLSEAAAHLEAAGQKALAAHVRNLAAEAARTGSTPARVNTAIPEPAEIWTGESRLPEPARWYGEFWEVDLTMAARQGIDWRARLTESALEPTATQPTNTWKMPRSAWQPLQKRWQTQNMAQLRARGAPVSKPGGEWEFAWPKTALVRTPQLLRLARGDEALVKLQIRPQQDVALASSESPERPREWTWETTLPPDAVVILAFPGEIEEVAVLCVLGTAGSGESPNQRPKWSPRPLDRLPAAPPLRLIPGEVPPQEQGRTARDFAFGDLVWRVRK
jgi:hypothetical protein